MSDGVSNPGGNLPTSTKVSDAAALIDKIASMNQAIAGSGYKYVEIQEPTVPEYLYSFNRMNNN